MRDFLDGATLLGEEEPPPNGTEKNTKRMSPDQRRELIIAEAVNFFAEYGFEGKTRDLAKRIGITQPLLYRYFPSKEQLIEQVYQTVYVRRWNPEWESWITDRNRPLDERLCRFYKAYAEAVYDYVWVRLFVYAGLKGVDINNRYLAIIQEKVLVPVATELRFIHNLPSPQETPIEQAEIELIWGLHGTFFYRAVRHFVYNMPMANDLQNAIENDVNAFLLGIPDIHKNIVKSVDT